MDNYSHKPVWPRYVDSATHTINGISFPKWDKVGGRFISARIDVPGDGDTFHFNNWGPRFGTVWNVRGDGKTLLKVNYGDYWNKPSVSLGNPMAAGGNNPWSRTYTWVDSNGD